MFGELPCSTAIINSTPVSFEKLKIQQKARTAKGTITIQILEKAKNTLAMKLISQSSILVGTQSARDHQLHLSCVWTVSTYHIQLEDWNSDTYWNNQACPKVSNMKTNKQKKSKNHPYQMPTLLIYLGKKLKTKSHGCFLQCLAAHTQKSKSSFYLFGWPSSPPLWYVLHSQILPPLLSTNCFWPLMLCLWSFRPPLCADSSSTGSVLNQNILV